MTAQEWRPQDYMQHAGFVPALGAPVLNLLAPQPGERILDLGCGEGTLTADLADRGARVFGIDSSLAQVQAARHRGLAVCVMDGQALGFGAAFEGIFSNAALHWMLDVDAVIQGVWQALFPGGRFIAECGGEGNIAAVQAGIYAEMRARGYAPEELMPWVFPGVEDYAARLRAFGFDIDYIELLSRPTPQPGDILGWLETFAQTFTKALPQEDHDNFLRAIRDRVRDKLCDAEGRWQVDYVRLRFAAHKP